MCVTGWMCVCVCACVRLCVSRARCVCVCACVYQGLDVCVCLCVCQGLDVCVRTALCVPRSEHQSLSFCYRTGSRPSPWRCSRDTTAWWRCCSRTTRGGASNCPRCTSPPRRTTSRPPRFSSRTNTTWTTPLRWGPPSVTFSSPLSLPQWILDQHTHTTHTRTTPLRWGSPSPSFSSSHVYSSLNLRPIYTHTRFPSWTNVDNTSVNPSPLSLSRSRVSVIFSIDKKRSLWGVWKKLGNFIRRKCKQWKKIISNLRFMYELVCGDVKLGSVRKIAANHCWIQLGAQSWILLISLSHCWENFAKICWCKVALPITGPQNGQAKPCESWVGPQPNEMLDPCLADVAVFTSLSGIRYKTRSFIENSDPRQNVCPRWYLHCI